MFDIERSGDERPTVFFLHYLGGSAREWSRVGDMLAARMRCVAIDLPGFGDAARVPGYTVADMAAFVTRAIRAEAPRSWLLVGHSMGAKVAAVIARSAENGAAGLAGLAGLVLVAGSPPSPEPMQEAQRQKMLSWFAGDAEANRADAERYVASNSGSELAASSREVAVADALRTNREAWLAWLESGSREDWSETVAILRTPALVIAGADDENLGPEAQRTRMAPHFARVRSVSLAGAKHLLPMERSHDVARLIEEHERFASYQTLIASVRVSAKTREALSQRQQPDDPAYEPVALDATALTTLRAVLDRVLPQEGFARIDVAARLDTELASEDGDGWRFAELPPDARAYRAALETLCEEAERRDGHAFAELPAERQDDILAEIAAARFGNAASAPGRLRPSQMRSWFEDLRGDAVRLYMGHPQTLARMGYSGIAYGGDGEPKSGFARVGVGEREAWEPVAARDANA